MLPQTKDEDIIHMKDVKYKMHNFSLEMYSGAAPQTTLSSFYMHRLSLLKPYGMQIFVFLMAQIKSFWNPKPLKYSSTTYQNINQFKVRRYIQEWACANQMGEH